MTRGRFASLREFLQARVSPRGNLGLPFTIAVLLVMGAAWLFAGIADEVMHGEPITRIDDEVAQWFYSSATIPLTRVVLFFTHVHSAPGLLLLSAVFALFLVRKNERYWLLTLALTVPGCMLLNVALKHVFQRARPSFDEPLLTLTTYSFPSGHAAGSTVFYGVLAAYLLCKIKSSGWRSVIVLSAFSLVTLVALSRMYLGVHYLSDVLAGIVVGIAWLTLILAAVAALRPRRSRHDADQT
jgi:membrane-associated phospholipid phosphatase